MKSTAPAPHHAHLEPLVYSIAQACQVSTLGRTKLFALIGENKLEVRRIGKRTLVLADSLRRLIENGA